MRHFDIFIRPMSTIYDRLFKKKFLIILKKKSACLADIEIKEIST